MTPSEQSYRLIPLSRGLFAIVDAADYEWLNQWKWSIQSTGRGFYVMRQEGGRKNRVLILMHRFILGLQRGDKRQGDHINRNGLDNRRSNLRIATCSQNCCNAGPRTNNKSGYKGVSWNKDMNKWAAQIQVEHRHTVIGFFETKDDAYAAYCENAKRLHGEFARLA